MQGLVTCAPVEGSNSMPGIVKTGTKSYIVCRSLGLSPIGTRTPNMPRTDSFMAITPIVELPPRPRGLNRWRLWPGRSFQFPFSG